MLAMVPKNHPHHRKGKGALDSVDDRETPADVYDPLNAEFKFTLDVAAARHNAKCARYYTLGPANDVWLPKQRSLFELVQDIHQAQPDTQALGYDGLVMPWARGERIWCNPPFSNIEPWVERATFSPATVVMLLPANRTEQPWWQKYIEPFRDGEGVLDDDPRTHFLAGRRNFKNRGEAITNRTSKNPPFGIVIVTWDRREKNAAAA